MEKAMVNKSKYDDLVDEFVSRKETTPWCKLKDFAIGKGVPYYSFRQAVARKGVTYRQGKNPDNRYTILQIGVKEQLYLKIKAIAEKEKISLPKVVKNLIEKHLEP